MHALRFIGFAVVECMFWSICVPSWDELGVSSFLELCRVHADFMSECSGDCTVLLVCLMGRFCVFG